MAEVKAAGRTTARAARASETRQRLVAAAVRLFSDAGYEEVAVAEVARAAGVAHGLLFHYFGSKRGIYLEAMRAAARELNDSFVVRPELPPALQLSEALAAHLRHLATHRGLALRLVLGGRGADPEAWQEFEAARWRAIEWAATLLGLDAQRPALRLAGRAVVGAIDEATVFWLRHGEPFELAALVDWMIEMATSALRAAARLDPELDVDAALRSVFGESSPE